MRKIFFLLTIFFAAFQMQCQPGTLVDEIIAVVGNEVILRSDLETLELESTGGKGGATDQQRCKNLETLLYQKLLLHQSKMDSLEVPEAEVQSQVTKRIEYYIQMFGSVEEFEKYYGKSQAQMKDEFFDLIQEQMLVQKMQEAIAKNLKITPADVVRYAENIPPDSIPLIGEQVEYSKIQISPVIRETEKNKIIQVMDSIRSVLVSGKSSMTLEAAKWSEDPGSKYKGGCYPMQRKGSFVPEYEAAVFNTPQGSYSPVFSSTYGYHFVKVIEKRGEFYESCHILISAKSKPEDLELARVKLMDVHEQLKDTLTFSLAVKRYSTDADTRNQGGKVMNAATGSTRHDVASLSSEMNLMLMSMKPGEFSEPTLLTADDNTKSFVIYRLDRRVPAHKANLKEDYEIFKQATEAKLRQEITDKWIRKRLLNTSIEMDHTYLNCMFTFPWIKNK
ncbi:MAG: peptidylprolyl isomerase [Flavobacteriales bacterium]